MRRLTPQQQALAAANQGLAWTVARRYFCRVRDADSCNELGAVALLALCRAARDFDPSSKNTFSTYAGQCCRNAIIDALCNEGLISTPRYLSRQAAARHRFQAVRSLAREALCDTDFLASLVEHGGDPVYQAELNELRARIRALPSRDCFVVEQILEGWSQQEIGCKLGCSRKVVRRLINRALAFLRETQREEYQWPCSTP